MAKYQDLTPAQIEKIEREAAEIRNRVMNRQSKFDEGVEKPQRTQRQPRPSRARPSESQRGANMRRYDSKEMVRLHTEEGLTSAQIAERLGCHRKTVVNQLKKLDSWDPANEGKGGRPKRDFCDEGHDQAVWRRESPKGSGNWHCHKCKVERNAEYRKAKAAKKRDNRLELLDEDLGFWMLVLEGEEVGRVRMSVNVAHALDHKLQSLSHHGRPGNGAGI